MTAPTVLAGHGLAVDLPQRWEGRLYLRDGSSPDPSVHLAAYGWPGERANPVLHLANFALPPGRGDFGTGAVETMSDRHVFVSMVEYNREQADTALFAAQGLPRLTRDRFGPNQLQRRLAGQLGSQTFFTDQDRAFCLYVVLGSERHAVSLVQEVHEVVARLRITRRDVPTEGGQPWL